MPSTSSDRVLYEPLNRTTRGSSAENIRRGRSIKRTLCCRFLLFIAVASVLGGAYLFTKFARNVWKTVNVSHHDLILANPSYSVTTDKDSNVLKKTFLTVSPLVRSNDSFSIRATVWLDVTQHLQQGHSLPTTLTNGSPLKVITYNIDSNTTRSEMILYSDVIFKDIKSKERHSNIIPLSIPIDPLYTQELGPSTLRMTYTAEVDSDQIEKELGKLQLGQGIFPFSSLVLPRSQSSVRIEKGCDGSKAPLVEGSVSQNNILAASTLEESLEINGASTALLSLRSTQKSKLPNCTYNANINLLYQAIPGFLDNSPDRRSFTRQTVLDKQGRRLILANNCQMFTPVIQTHSSIYLARSNEALDKFRYIEKLEHIRKRLQPCFDEKEETLPSHCFQELRNHSPLENWLTFYKNDTDGSVDSQMRYGPAIVQRQFATPPWEQRVIPRTRPTNDIKETKKKVHNSLGEPFWLLKSNEKKKIDMLEKCTLPQLEADDSNQFFNINVNVRFGKDLGSIRSSLIELDLSSLDKDSSSKIELDFLQDEDEEMPILNSIDKNIGYEMESFLASDHFHPNRKSFVKILTFILLEVSSLIIFLLSILYWYTRTTTAGLSIRAQWIQSFGVMIRLILIMFDLKNDGILSSTLLYVIGIGLCFILKTLALTRIDFIFPQEGQSWLKLRIIQRPKDKAEKRCERVEQRQLGWSRIGFILAFFLVLCFISGREGFLLTRGRGCSMTLQEDDSQDRKKLIKQWASLIAHTITAAGQAIQIWFNTISPSIHIRKEGKSGSFAGMFKTTAYLDAFNLVWEQLVSNVERIGGHSVRREAIVLDFVQTSIEKIVLFWQALQYPGIPQTHGNDGEEEEEEEFAM